MALGALATAATFVLVLINQKGTQKQIDSLSQMAEMFSRHYNWNVFKLEAIYIRKFR